MERVEETRQRAECIYIKGNLADKLARDRKDTVHLLHKEPRDGELGLPLAAEIEKIFGKERQICWHRKGDGSRLKGV